MTDYPNDIQSWGRYPNHPPDQVGRLSRDPTPPEPPAIVHGMGRSYGDGALGDHVLRPDRLDHFINADWDNGTIMAEAGVTLDDILKIGVPKGWFLPVTPGTKFVSIGGAIAADIHGKNHHQAGCFSEFVDEITLFIPDKGIITCSPNHHTDLFHATCGGMGLTGMILSAKIRLKPIQSAYIRQTTIKARDLSQLIKLFEKHDHSPYTVAWIDCITGNGRGHFMMGDHIATGELTTHDDPKWTMPVDLPSWALNRFTVRAFNTLYYHRQIKRRKTTVVHYDPFFYPLDKIHHWNRLYGSPGFVQYQFVVPTDQTGFIQTVLDRFQASGCPSFLAVLKKLGPTNKNYLSFPMAGYTLALDLKPTDENLTILDELDDELIRAGGRVYLAKDARQSPATLRAGYPDLDKFQAVRKKYNLTDYFQSDLSRRLEI
jgi:FAD/FMN-containing dehydrogenase